MAHCVVADGSGRDSNIFQDGGWRLGKQWGFGKVPEYHPIFSTGKKPIAFTFEPGTAPPASRKGDTQEASRRLSSSAPTVYRMNGNAALMFLPKEKKSPTNMMQQVSSEGRLSGAGKSAGAGNAQRSASAGQLPHWRTRETCTGFKSWADRLPASAQSKKIVKTSVTSNLQRDKPGQTGRPGRQAVAEGERERQRA